MKLRKQISLLLASAIVFTSGSVAFPLSVSGADDPNVYHLTDLSLSDGASVPLIEGTGTFGRASGEDGSVVYHTDPEGDYVTLEHPEGSADLSPSLAFSLPQETSSENVVTVEYDLRLETPLETNDKYITAGFNSLAQLNSNGFGFDMFSARSMLNRNAQVAVQGDGTWSFVDTSWPKKGNGDMETGVWNRFKISLNLKTGDYETYVNDTLTGTSRRAVTRDDITMFVIGFGNWGGNPALTYSIRDMQVTLSQAPDTGGEEDTDAPDPDPGNQGPAWSAPENAQAVWSLNEQIAAAQVGDTLPKNEDAGTGVFSTYFGKVSPDTGEDCITVEGEGDQRYVAIRYSKADERTPSLMLSLPETYRSGTFQADYKLYMLPGSGMHWHESGFGHNVFGSDGGFAAKIVHNNPGYAAPGGIKWQAVNRTFQAGGWYRYTVTIDLSNLTMKVDIYLPGETAPTTYEYDFTSYAEANKEISQFVVQPYSPATPGVLCVKDLSVCYVPADKTPKPSEPKNGTQMLTIQPTFQWTNTGADSYRLEISKNEDFSGDVQRIEGLTDTAYTLDAPLDYYTTYYWRVVSLYDGEEERQSAVWNFTTEIEDTPDNVYYAGEYGLVEGGWDEVEGTGIPERNTSILQGLLDKAGRNGGGTVILPESTYCITGDSSVYGSTCLYIRYDNLTLTGAGKDENGNYKTVLKTNYKWDGPNHVFRSEGIRIMGEPFGSEKPRQNIEISHFEMDGGRGWNGKSDWGYEQDVDYGWDISHKGIIVAQDNLVTHVTLDDLYVHSYSGETLYVGGKAVGYLEVKNCTLADTNASCFNLYAAYLDVHDNQFGSPDGKCRFWIEYCPRKSDIQYEMPPVPEGIEKDTAHFYRNKFYNAVNAHGIAIAQGDCTTYSMIFEDNEIDNRLDTDNYGIFQLAGAVYGPIIIRNNVIRNTDGPVLVFSYGGGTVDENGVPNVDWMLNKNIYLENNTGYNLGGPIIDLMGSWGVWDPNINDGAGGTVPAPQPVEDLYIRNNHFIGASPDVKSVAIGSFYGTIDSAIDLKGVEITGNTFENCIAPEEVYEFLGNVPLFRDNTYIDTVATSLGGIAELNAENTLLKPVYESLLVNASEAVTAQMRTGRNEDTQTVVLTGAPDSADVTFTTDGQGYVVPETIVLTSNDQLTLRYDAASQLWQFVSFEKDAVADPGEEKPDPGEEEKPGEENPGGTTPPQTGDPLFEGVVICLLLASGAFLAASLLRRKARMNR